ncbi:hypothetical protein EI427_17370 [Flammeovirga pectinis]|uniref:Exo-alpha-sialidase n=1 Tax=Flammeovirga pectinis TaxID=2494373 RepID=A0A3S9P6U7_9BACT|nr:hypothetical protein [Flammeovirga pectinis]AZQ63931.1 hypothetical protein EI427_17370 [Flammeovirga pectinis]
MKQIFTSILLCILFVTANAQTYHPTLNVGEKEGKGVAETDIGVIGKTDTEIIHLTAKGKGVAMGIDPFGFINPVGIKTKVELNIHLYDYALTLKKELPLGDIKIAGLNNPPEKNFEFTYQDKKKNIWIIYSTNSKGANHLYRTKLNESRTGFEKPILISRQQIGADKINKQSSYSIELSESKDLMCIYSFSSNKKGKSTSTYVEVLDADFNRKWIMYSKVPQYEKNNFTNKLDNTYSKLLNGKNKNTLLSEMGVFHYFNSVTDKKNNNITHILYSFSEGKRNAIIKPITNDKIKKKGLHLVDYNKQLCLIGLYSNKEEKEFVIEGLFIEIMDPVLLKTTSEKMIKFTNNQKKDFLISNYFPETSFQLNKFISKDNKVAKKLEKKSKIEIENDFIAHNVFINNNQSFTFVVESFKESSIISSTTTGGVGSSRFLNYYEDLCFINFTKEGTINWVSNFHKYQKIDDNTFFSRGLFLEQKEDQLLFMYPNLNVDQIQYGEVSLDGKIKAKDIYTLKNKRIEGYWFDPGSFELLTDRQFLGNSIRSFKKRMIMMDLKTVN